VRLIPGNVLQQALPLTRHGAPAQMGAKQPRLVTGAAAEQPPAGPAASCVRV
jgi:hypothetical protein